MIVDAGILGRAHTIAAMDPTKLQTASGAGPQAAGIAASGVVTPAALSDSAAWKKQRPGAAFFEKLQVSCFVTMLWVICNSVSSPGLVCNRP